MSVPGLFIRKGRSWVVALVFLLFAVLTIAFVPEQSRNASSTDALAAGFDSTRVVELQEQFEDDGTSNALILFTADSGTLTEEQINSARMAIFEQLGIPAEAVAAMQSGGGMPAEPG
nr:hypothetical protein [Actinomycetales bacterium]